MFVICLLLTQSSTGYLCLLFLTLVGGSLCALHFLRRGGLSRGIGVVIVIAAIGITVVVNMGTTSSLVNKEIRSVLIEKANSPSYRDRNRLNMVAMGTARQTYFLGAGWGSVRCSGLQYLLVSTVGIPGIILFSCVLVAICVPLRETRSAAATKELYARVLFATIVTLFGMAVSGADTVSPILWILLGAASAGPELKTRRSTHRGGSFISGDTSFPTVEQGLLFSGDLS
jgi:O-antigen ligase